MSKLVFFILFSSSVTILEVFSYNFKSSIGNNNPGYFWSNGFRQQFSQSQVQPSQAEEPKDSEEDPEYMYELLFGHQIRDIEKYKRQKGCLCNNRFRDPHCGTDYKLYDNGCYFECAQKRTPGLKLLNWGKC